MTIDVRAADEEIGAIDFRITRVYQDILNRDPRSDETAFWKNHYPGYSGLARVLNQSAERQLAIAAIYNRALKRDPQDYEMDALVRFVAPANRIREQLFSSQERRLALEDAYWGILGRRPTESELSFYLQTRSPFDRIKNVLSSSEERVYKLTELFQKEICRDPRAGELKQYQDNHQYLYPIRTKLRATAEYKKCHPVKSPTPAPSPIPAPSPSPSPSPSPTPTPTPTPVTDDVTPSFLFGLVHYHYYGNLGGYSGAPFINDQKWAAENIDFGIIGWGDSGMDRAWEEMNKNEIKGNWLKWRLAHLFNTYETAGTCDAPKRGEIDQTFAYQTAELAEFLSAYPAYGDGEGCFLHTNNAGTIRPRWHAMGCEVELETESGARLESLVWSEYGWQFDVSSDCTKDFIAWRTIKDIEEEGRGGIGFDNLGSPLSDNYYLPEQVDPVDIAEIPDGIEYQGGSYNESYINDNWYFPAVEELLEYVAGKVQAYNSSKSIVYNGASYCSWKGGPYNKLKNIAAPGLGIWCEDALQYPSWGWFDDDDRMSALIELSSAVSSKDGFMVHESFYNGGSSDPTAPEVMFYLASHYIYRNQNDVLAIKPDWNPYSLLSQVTWFDVFSRDIGTPTSPPTTLANGVFKRDYKAANGTKALVLSRVDGDNGNTINYTLNKTYCRVDADNDLRQVSGSIGLKSGDGIILLEQGQGGITCN